MKTYSISEVPMPGKQDLTDWQGNRFVAAFINAKPYPYLLPPLYDYYFIRPELDIIPRDQLKPGHWLFLRPATGRLHGSLATHMYMYVGDGKVIDINRQEKPIKLTTLEKTKKLALIEKRDPEEIKQWRLENGIP